MRMKDAKRGFASIDLLRALLQRVLIGAVLRRDGHRAQQRDAADPTALGGHAWLRAGSWACGAEGLYGRACASDRPPAWFVGDGGCRGEAAAQRPFSAGAGPRRRG